LKECAAVASELWDGERNCAAIVKVTSQNMQDSYFCNHRKCQVGKRKSLAGNLPRPEGYST
jgi:hypothetical protein